MNFSYLSLSALILLIPVLSSGAEAHERSWPGKRLAETWPEANKFTQKQVSLGTAQVQWIEKTLEQSIRSEDRAPAFFPATAKDDKKIGVVLFLDATGSNGKIELGLAIAPEGKVVHLVLFENGEGSGINSAEFLSQFTGKKSADKFKVGDDVVASKSSEAAAQSVATAVRRGLLIAKASQMTEAQTKEPSRGR
jgi:hypothetical protein